MTDSTVEADIREALCALLPRLRRFARTLARNPADADDLLQVALERALKRSAQWRRDERLDAWVFGIIRNAWIDEVRARQRGNRVFAPEEYGDHVGDSPIERRELAMTVHAAMQRLPEEQRMAIALVLIEGLSYQEAAQALQIPIGTLTSRLARGRGALQALLGGAVEAGA